VTLLLALALDALFGEPKWLWSRLPHPAVLMGNLIARATSMLNRAPYQKAKGVIICIGLVALGGLGGLVLAQLGAVAEILVTAILVAQKSLMQHVQDVAQALRLSLAAGRKSVAMIVGRDTAQMDAPQVARGAIESAAENFSDGIAAPVFWFALAGLPGVIIYKMINTADSMIGYKNATYQDFGWACARLDDLLNWVPARLSALGIWLITGCRISWSTIASDAKLHRSPNAGWPEAAMAYALDVSLSGPRSYEGKLEKFPWVNSAGRKNIGPVEIEKSIQTLWLTWGAMVLLVACMTLALWV
jgi:adenosylcobinamide-phosphate synthase